MGAIEATGYPGEWGAAIGICEAGVPGGQRDKVRGQLPRCRSRRKAARGALGFRNRVRPLKGVVGCFVVGGFPLGGLARRVHGFPRRSGGG